MPVTRKRKTVLSSVVLRAHQQHVVNYMRTTSQRGILLWHSLGSGKTITALSIAQLYPYNVMIICPASTREQWAHNVTLMLPKHTKVAIHSYESVARVLSRNTIDASNTCLILDEVHRLRNASGAIANRISVFAQSVMKVVCLTATPMVNSVLDLSIIINMIAAKTVLPTNEVEFQNEFYTKTVQMTNVPKTLRCSIYSPIGCSDNGKIYDGRLCKYHLYRKCKRGSAKLKRKYKYKYDKEYEVSQENRIHMARRKVQHIHHKPNIPKYIKKISNWVSYYTVSDAILKQNYPERINHHYSVKMSPAQAAAYDKAAKGFLSATERTMIQNNDRIHSKTHALNVFLNQTRQISNTTNASVDSPKLIEISKEVRKFPKPAIIYSNWLSNGIEAMRKRLVLDDSKLRTLLFTGSMNDQEKSRAMQQYNSGQLDILLISSSGSEGLDLKNTRQVHIMEPHWNLAKIEQVVGRAIRYQSHLSLPPKERNVRVCYWIAQPPSGKGADEYLYHVSNEKKKEMQMFQSAIQHHSV